MNLVKSHLAKHLQMENNNVFTIKRNDQYANLANNTLKFQYITSYLSTGINYASFLKSLRCERKQRIFSKWFDDLTKLERTSLPPNETFYSSLKQTNISHEKYTFCKSVWTENSMTTLRDFLVWYNKLDVGHFVTSEENMQRYYFKRNIDIFQVSISVPGLARHMKFESGRKPFDLLDEKNKYLYYSKYQRKHQRKSQYPLQSASRGAKNLYLRR